MTTHAPRAVFLSYAREDTTAARRVAEALRGSGIEAWFDASELRGGEEWDRQIRRQIKGCGLFMPVISEHTQARREGYFRLEWKLAEERTHLMAKGTPFLLPVSIDATNDRTALVPDSFLVVQWARLPGGEPVGNLPRFEGGPLPQAHHRSAGHHEPLRCEASPCTLLSAWI